MIIKGNNDTSNATKLERKLSNCGQKTLIQLYVKLALVAGFKAVVLILCTLTIVSYSVHRIIVWHKGHTEWELSPIMDLERPCPSPSYDTLPSLGKENNLKICLTTLTDHKTQLPQWRRMIRWRNYDDILDLTWESKQQYAQKHGYHLYDGSAWVDVSRPAQWSKIKAVQHLLEKEHCDWVLWHDADTLFMNTNVKIEDFLPADPNKELLVAVDTPNPGYNSGSWLVKNSPWGRQFLQDWWDMGPTYVRRAGQSLSGDNDALKALLQSYPKDEFDTHVAVPPRCTINAFAKFLQPNQNQEAMTPTQLKKQPWYLSEHYYHKGDFLVHVPGYDNKIGTLKMLLDRIQ